MEREYLPRSDYTRVGRGHDQGLDMDMEYDSPPTSLMEAMFRAGTKISLGSSSTSTSTAVYDETGDVGPAASTMKFALRKTRPYHTLILSTVYTNKVARPYKVML